MLGLLKKAAPWILFGLAAIAAATFAVLWLQAQQEQNEADDVRSIATEFVEALTNFSADTMDSDAERIRSFAVGEFEREAEAFFGERAVQAIQEAEATSEGTIDSLFIQSVEDDTASAFAVVEQSITNAADPAGATDTLRMEISLVRTGDEWKVENVDVLQSPGTIVPGA